MCAIETGKRGRKTLVLDHSAKIAEKIRISGGGRCNFTNLHCAPDRYISANPHFMRSALARYSQHDFIAMVERHGIAFHEKTLGQLFCDHSAGDIIEMLLKECADANVVIKTATKIERVEKESGYIVHSDQGAYCAQSLVVACGGLSIPKIGATPFGYQIAEQFGHSIIPPRAGLVPLTFAPDTLEQTKELSGISISPASVSSEDGKIFDEAVLFTHRGISGPAILQISSYWKPGEVIAIDIAQ
ncbi:MAG: aminoacetone oxidase family FAD-binding enzyme, partial [Micavibrio aeruginosavorus]